MHLRSLLTLAVMSALLAGLAACSARAQTTTGAPALAGCPIFPENNVWNQRVDRAPVSPFSRRYIQSIGARQGLKADFGAGLWEGGSIGIPFMIAEPGTPRSAVRFEYDDESDAGPYPIPSPPLIEGGPDSDGDRHILVVEPEECKLYELYAAYPEGPGRYRAGSGAIYDLRSNALRPAGWTSADAAGLPILPGLARYDEVASGEIRHALRFTVQRTQRAYVWPARHYASSRRDTALPPMGQRFRLKANVNLSGFSPETRVILVTLQRYGMILADNGSNWYISGAPDERWNNRVLRELARIKGDQFEAVDVSRMQAAPDSGEVRLR